MSEGITTRRLGVLTSGGDAPGMNAVIRAFVRSAIHKGWDVYGIRSGFAGLLAQDFLSLGWRDVSGIIQQGGTVLRSARCPEFVLAEAQERAIGILRDQHITGLVVVGGNGSQAGAHALATRGFPVVGVGATIDNDLFGAEIAVGVDSALNVAVEAIDRLKVTAASHQRAFLVEVMGNTSGYLALVSAIAGGAEVVVVPEVHVEPAAIAGELRGAYDRGHAHAIAVVAEGAQNNADVLERYFQAHGTELGFELRVTKLGHVQRGGTPGVFDRLLGTRLGAAACDYLGRGEAGVFLGMVGGKIRPTSLAEAATNKKVLEPELIALARVLAH